MTTTVGDEFGAPTETPSFIVGVGVSIGVVLLLLLIIVIAICIIRLIRKRKSQTPTEIKTPHYATHIANQNQLQNAQQISSYSTYVSSEQTTEDPYYSSQIQNTRPDGTRQSAPHIYNDIQEMNTVNTRNEEAGLSNTPADKNMKEQSISYAELDFSNNVQYSSIQNV